MVCIQRSTMRGRACVPESPRHCICPKVSERSVAMEEFSEVFQYIVWALLVGSEVRKLHVDHRVLADKGVVVTSLCGRLFRSIDHRLYSSYWSWFGAGASAQHDAPSRWLSGFMWEYFIAEAGEAHFNFPWPRYRSSRLQSGLSCGRAVPVIPPFGTLCIPQLVPA